MSRKTAFMFVVIYSVLAGVFLGIFVPFFLIPARKVVLRTEITPNTQVLVVRARHFSDIELENQKVIAPEDFLKKMKRGEFKVVLFPKSSSEGSFKTIGFGKYVYVVKEKGWRDWCQNLMSLNPKISPYIVFPYTSYTEVKIKTDIKGNQPVLTVILKRNPLKLVATGLGFLVAITCISGLYISYFKK